VDFERALGAWISDVDGGGRKRRRGSNGASSRYLVLFKLSRARQTLSATPGGFRSEAPGRMQRRQAAGGLAWLRRRGRLVVAVAGEAQVQLNSEFVQAVPSSSLTIVPLLDKKEAVVGDVVVRIDRRIASDALVVL
jgi:hypothetical protein